MQSIKEIRESSGLSRVDFSKRYSIPVRTLEDWESEKRKCPEYVNKLLGRVVEEDRSNFILYKDIELLKELGSCYQALINTLHKHNKTTRIPHNPYPNCDIFPIKYFTIVLHKAMSCGIPKELNNRIARFMNFIDSEDWTECMNKPCPVENRMYFLMGMQMESYGSSEHEGEKWKK